MLKNNITMLLGLRTVIYHVSDLAAAKAWYTAAFGVAPYFDQPFYVGFEIGGFELGLDPDSTGITTGNSSVAYWGVTDVYATLQHLSTIGATAQGPVREVGGDIKVATVGDPDGNVIGLIENPHFKGGR